MILLTVAGVRKHYGPEPVLDGVDFDVRPGERIALVGPNGAGKTTLLKILARQDEPDGGRVDRHPGARWGFLEQHPQFEPGRTVWDEAQSAVAWVLGLAREAETLAQQIGQCGDEAERRRLGERFDHVQHLLQQHDAYQVERRLERVLSGLGFAASSYQQPVGQLSGGQQNRLLLARLLLEEPDLMLLDEPSNHLDIDATQWLEDFLVDTNATLLVVSHDRYFLDRVTNRTLELLHGTVDSYPGNFTQYQRLKGERLEVQRRTFEKQQTEIAKMEDFIRRNAYGDRHAQAEDRRKKLERIERVVLPREIAAPPMGFPAASRTGDLVLRVEGLSKAFDRPLFANLSFDVLRGEKWGILGPNGCGKTTLLKCLLGHESPTAGRATWGSGVKVGYFDQQLSGVPPETEALEAVRPDHKEFLDQQRRDLLARFGVTGDMVFQPVGSLSGGERNRTFLARLAALDANVLLLDEPTNHLDLWARASLERALQAFDGTVIFVSHDRYFLNQVADKLLIVEPGRFRVIDGNYDTYRHFLKHGLAAEARGLAASGSAKTKAEPAPRDESKPARPERRKRKFPYRKVADIEAEIAQREARVAELHQELGSPDVLRDGRRVKQVMGEMDEQQAALAQLYEHWEEASETQG